jgi:hypothetical protein
MRNHHVRLPRDLLPWQHVLLGSSSSSRPSSAAFVFLHRSSPAYRLWLAGATAAEPHRQSLVGTESFYRFTAKLHDLRPVWIH